jgi:outer membrane protein assembly factor BamE (lipoprotein component of BamABCDE complex)
MNVTRQRLFLSGVMVSLVGCALVIPEESRYLKEAQDRATQQEVQARLGNPRSIASAEAGQSVWVYEVRQVEPGAQNTWAAMGSWCDEYTLTFDQGGVLRQWTHKSYQHAGEMMPITCHNGIGVEKPAL